MNIDEDLKQLEEKVMGLLFAGDYPALKVLREQWKSSVIKEVQLTGVGFFINYEIPDDCPRISGSLTLSDVTADIKGVKNGVGFILFVKDGVLTMLEGATYDDPWPEKIEIQKIYYVGDQERNYKELEQKLAETK